MNFKIKTLLATAALLFCFIPAPQANDFAAKRIAHAGGGIDGKTYTNSYEALDLNTKNGFDYFEIDFSFTSDGKLVCIHDWDHSFERSFGFKVDQPPNYNVFKYLAKDVSTYEKCTLEGLRDWMTKNPSAKIVTDIKDLNLIGLKQILGRLPDAKNRVIPQIYQPESFLKVKMMGYDSIIWTLYRYQGDLNQIMYWVNTFNGKFAITMNKNVALKTKLPYLLRIRNTPMYVHTINDPKEADFFMNTVGLSELYIDFLTP